MEILGYKFHYKYVCVWWVCVAMCVHACMGNWVLVVGDAWVCIISVCG